MRLWNKLRNVTRVSLLIQTDFFHLFSPHIGYSVFVSLQRWRVGISHAHTAADGSPAIEQFCTGETFRPRCAGGKNDVIVTISARYGRMNFGRCLKQEPGFAPMMSDRRFFGCSDDVKDIIDRHCSGRSECDVRINDQNFDGVVKSCYADLKMHLEVSYVCVKGWRIDIRTLIFFANPVNLCHIKTCRSALLQCSHLNIGLKVRKYIKNQSCKYWGDRFVKDIRHTVLLLYYWMSRLLSGKHCWAAR